MRRFLSLALGLGMLLPTATKAESIWLILGVDEDNGPTNSFIDAGLGVGFESFGNYSIGTLMIRAEVDAANALSINDDVAESIPNEFLLITNKP